MAAIFNPNPPGIGRIKSFEFLSEVSPHGAATEWKQHMLDLSLPTLVP